MALASDKIPIFKISGATRGVCNAWGISSRGARKGGEHAGQSERRVEQTVTER